MLFNFPNLYYPTAEAYIEAAAKALSAEYRAIVDAGFNLQLDAPDLAMRAHCWTGSAGKADIKNYVPMAIEAMNEATRGLPPEKVRLHLCWGNYAGPHHHDVELKEIIEPVLKTNAGSIYFEAANPRHAHEWEVWEEVKIPDGKVLIPGVIDTLTNHVEHPRLVAQRLEKFAAIVGRENVIAGTDCGFGTFVGWSGCDPKVAWLKLEAMAQGARIASDRLWRQRASHLRVVHPSAREEEEGGKQCQGAVQSRPCGQPVATAQTAAGPHAAAAQEHHGRTAARDRGRLHPRGGEDAGGRRAARHHRRGAAPRLLAPGFPHRASAAWSSWRATTP